MTMHIRIRQQQLPYKEYGRRTLEKMNQKENPERLPKGSLVKFN